MRILTQDPPRPKHETRSAGRGAAPAESQRESLRGSDGRMSPERWEGSSLGKLDGKRRVETVFQAVTDSTNGRGFMGWQGDMCDREEMWGEAEKVTDTCLWNDR